VLDSIRNAANSGKIGDGKLFATPLEEVIRIRTGGTRGRRRLTARNEETTE